MAAAVAVAAGSVAQAVTGFGFSLVCVPVLVLLVEPVDAVRLSLVLATAANLAVMAREHRGVDLAAALRLLLPALVVAPVAAVLVRRVDDAALSIAIGVIVVACGLALASGRRAESLRGTGGLVAAGTVSAFMNTASGVGGPTVSMYAVNAGWPPEMVRPTLQVYFLGLNVATLAALGPVTTPFFDGVVLVAAVVAGFLAGVAVERRVGKAAVARAMVLLSVAGGVAAVVKGVVEAMAG